MKLKDEIKSVFLRYVKSLRYFDHSNCAFEVIGVSPIDTNCKIILFSNSNVLLETISAFDDYDNHLIQVNNLGVIDAELITNSISDNAGNSNSIHFVLKSCFSAIEEAVSAIDKFLLSNLKDLDTFNLHLIIREILANAIGHGNENKLAKNVSISIFYFKDEDVIRIYASDQGKGFDFNKMLNDSESQGDLRKRHRGLSIIKQLGRNIVNDTKKYKRHIIKVDFDVHSGRENGN